MSRYLICCLAFLTWINAVSGQTRLEEPVCTARYDYEHRVVYSIVTMEIQLKHQQERLDKLSQRLDDDSVLKDEMAELRETMEKQKRTIDTMIDHIQDIQRNATEQLWESVTRHDSAIASMLAVNEDEQRRNKMKALSAFTATDPREASIGSDMAFTSVVLNEGNNYNTSTGHFKCVIPGLYFFTLSLTKIRSSNDSINDMVYCKIRKNGTDRVHAHIDPEDNYADGGSYGTTASVTLRLALNDVVSVGGCSKSATMESTSQFSGFLIAPDH